MFSIRCDPLLVVFPQRGYRRKPISNQKISAHDRQTENEEGTILQKIKWMGDTATIWDTAMIDDLGHSDDFWGPIFDRFLGRRRRRAFNQGS